MHRKIESIVIVMISLKPKVNRDNGLYVYRTNTIEA